MLDICHIVKYSHERLLDYGDLRWGPNVNLEIQTLGRGGVRFRHRDGRGRRAVWHHSDAPPMQKFADSCGAGDWFSTGIIHGLCRQGKKALLGFGLLEVSRAIAFAQRLSVWNCGYLGARGGMYSTSGRAALKSIARLQDTLIAPSAKPERDGITAMVCGCVVETRVEAETSTSLHQRPHVGTQIGKAAYSSGLQSDK